MIELIGAILLIALGLAFILWKKNAGTSKSETKKVDIKKTPEAAGPAEKKLFISKVPLESLVVPGNFPSEVPIYFGSQTGTAEKFSGILEEEARKIGIENPRAADFEEFDPETFKGHELVILCVATHYEGDPCDNTKKFNKWIKELRKGKDQVFLGMKYTIFGLGDTSYEQFDFMAKFFDESF
jgi:sulfite reductase alpha subunit-like flavoprotein